MVDIPIKTSIYKGFSMAMLNNHMVNHTWIYTLNNCQGDQSSAKDLVFGGTQQHQHLDGIGCHLRWFTWWKGRMGRVNSPAISSFSLHRITRFLFSVLRNDFLYELDHNFSFIIWSLWSFVDMFWTFEARPWTTRGAPAETEQPWWE